MKKFGLTSIDLKVAQQKMDAQKKYLLDNEFTTSNGQVINLLHVSFSANHSERYYAQLANKINTMELFSIKDDLKGIFLTITLDGFFRDLLKGDYTRYDSFSEDKLLEIKKSTPNNDIHGFIHHKLDNKEKLIIKDLYNILSYQYLKFLKGYTLKMMKKNNDERMYIRTVEPHKDGVPHFHIMFFTKEQYIKSLKKDFLRACPAPRNSESLYKGSFDTHGFQTDINKPSAYILKYITKSFVDVKNKKDLDYIQAWYVKHRLMRVVTSRTLVPQWIYQKCSILENDWYYITDIIKELDSEASWSQEDNFFYFKDSWSNREIVYSYGLFQIYNNGRLVKEVGKVVEKKPIKTYERVPRSWYKALKPIPVYKDTKLTHFYSKGQFKEYKKHISNMNDYELLQFHDNYDIESDNYIYYLATKNLMIDRNLLNEQKYYLNNFDEKEFFSFKNCS